MLVLSRRTNEKVLFPTLGITVEVTSVSRNVVRLGFDAPSSVPIVRAEIASEPAKVELDKPMSANHRLRNRLHTASLAVHLAQKQLQAGFAKDAERTLGNALREYAELDQEMAAEVAMSTRKRELRTLLVEDNCNESMLLAEFLRLHGIEVQMAHDGQDALEYLQSHERPDFILLDMRMPRCDGPTVLAAVRANSAYDETKVFAVSGTDPEEFSVPMGSRGLDGWFSKPVNPMKLVDQMHNLSAKHHCQA